MKSMKKDGLDDGKISKILAKSREIEKEDETSSESDDSIADSRTSPRWIKIVIRIWNSFLKKEISQLTFVYFFRPKAYWAPEKPTTMDLTEPVLERADAASHTG